MVDVNSKQWKQFMEGMARGDIAQYKQVNSTEDELSIREYYDGDIVVARMTTHDELQSIKGSFECFQIFEVEEELLKKVEYIYIPTDEEWEGWDERSTLENRDVVSEEIAKREHK